MGEKIFETLPCHIFREFLLFIVFICDSDADTDPDSTFHPDADPADPYPTFHPDADPDPDPSFQT